jgi:hypothetical protein
MSDINDLSEEEKEQTQKWFDETYIERDKYSELEAENARLQAKNTELFEKFDKFSWQSAEKLPEEEGIYAIMTNNGYEWEFRLTACSLQATLMNINVYHARGYEFYDIKYLKLPNVEGK